MDGIHDMGGRQGFGLLRERDEEVFHAAWEKRVMGMTNLVLGLGCYDTDSFRHAIERIDPATYLSDGYYGRWLGAIETLVAEDAGRPAAGRIVNGTSARRIERAARFRVGQSVRTRRIFPSGHCRLPGYARGRVGTIALDQGAWVLPDARAHGRGESPEHVFAVRFDGSELWGDSAETGTCIHIDLFESYLEPA